MFVRLRWALDGWSGMSTGDAPMSMFRQQKGLTRMGTILWWIIAIIVIFWLLGMIGSIGGSLIHLLLVVALLLLIYNLITGRRAV